VAVRAVPAEQLLLPEALVTGEAVEVDLAPASFATRMLAWLLDLVVIGVAQFALFWGLAGLALVLESAAVEALALVLYVATLVGLPTVVETLTRGRSLGKLAAGLRVVRDDGGPIRVRQAFVRALLAVFECFMVFGSVAMISSLANPRGKRLGDLLAGTLVVRDRPASPMPPLPPVPPDLAAWARTADIGRLPDPLVMACRHLIARVRVLHPAARQRLGADLAAQVARRVSPAPPPGVGAEWYLVAVLAERSRREHERLLAVEQGRHRREQARSSASVLAADSSRMIL
jgi:uncharacterized RDD family membrane protein YckC